MAGIIILLQLSGSTDDYFIFSIVFMIMFIVSRDIQVKWKLGKQVTDVIDKYSYNIFLVHPAVFWFLPDCPVYAQIFWGVFGTVAVSYLSYQCVDKKMGRILRKIQR